VKKTYKNPGGYRLLALDMDNTLFDESLEISPRTERAIRAAVEKGVTVLLATGRMFRSALPFAERLGLGDVPLITYNGALVKTTRGRETLFHEPVPLPAARRIVEAAEERGYHYQVFVDDKLYVKEINEKVKRYQAIARVEAHQVGNIREWLKKPPTKMLVFEPAHEIKGIQDLLEGLVGDQVNLTISFPFFLEIVSLRASKGAALEGVARRLGIRASEIIAVGDSFNDLSMLEYAGLGVAVENAPDGVKRKANYITASCWADGVAHVIETFLL